jgi:hypothetical protein
MLTSSEVDEGFISGVMVSMLTSSEVDQGFISGVMVSMLTSSEVETLVVLLLTFYHKSFTIFCG